MTPISTQQQMNTVHKYLMNLGFPYHSVSVIYRPNDLGLHVIFMESVRDQVTEAVKEFIKLNGFGHTFTKEHEKENK